MHAAASQAAMHVAAYEVVVKRRVHRSSPSDANDGYRFGRPTRQIAPGPRSVSNSLSGNPRVDDTVVAASVACARPTERGASAMLSPVRRLGVRGPAVVAIFLIGLFTVGCQTGAGAAGPAPVGAAPGATAAAARGQADQGEGALSAGDATGGGEGGGQPPAAPADLLIIKTGTLSLQVTGLDTAITAATQKVTELGGYASASDRSGDGEDASASITFRIPAARWEEALEGLRGLAAKVLGEKSSTQDVTGQVIDLGARIKNLEATERALQAIMDRATEIKDVLSVQAELTKVRGEIEEMAAQKGHLEEQAAMSTLTVSFSLKPNPVQVEQQGFDPAAEAEQASASLVSVLQGVATAGIWFAIVWLPILVFLAIVGGIVLVVARRFRGAGPGDDTPVAPEAESAA
jgi:hypothetical protein